MADEKAPQPSGIFGGHDPIVIIVVVLLALTLLANLFPSQDTAGTSTQSNNAKDTVTETPAPSECGLAVFAPKGLQVITTTVPVSGTVGACQWLPVNGVALYAQVIDSAGKPLSDLRPIPAGERVAGVSGSTPDGIQEFNAVINLSMFPTTKTGFVVLTHPDLARTPPKTVRIPIQFKK